MTMYHAEPNRAEPSKWLWFSVETPSVFQEAKLPACEADWAPNHQRTFATLEAIAERHGTHIHRSTYRRG